MLVIRLLYPKFNNKQRIICSSLLSIGYLTSSVYAVETVYYADFVSKTTYFDNLYFRPDKTSDYEQKLSAHLQLEKNLEHINNRAYLDLSQYLYLRNNQSNNTNYRLGYDYGYYGQRNNFLASVYYSSNGSRNAQIADDNLVINPGDDYRKNTAYMNLSWSHNFSERINLVTQTGLNHTEYDTPQHNDYDNYTLSSLLYYQISPLLSVNGGIYTFYYSPKDSLIDNNIFLGLVLGFDYQINEKWFFGGKTSQGRTETNYNTLDDTVNNTGLYEMGLSYTGERSGFGIDASRNEEPSNNGDLRIVERTGADYYYNLSERQFFKTSIYWRRSTQNHTFNDETNYYRGLRLSMNRNLSKHFRGNIFYKYEYRKQIDFNADSNSIGFEISYHWQ